MTPLTDAQVDSLALAAEQSITLLNQAASTHLEATAALVQVQYERPYQKMAALARLCTTQHPVTGKTYSVSQAEDVLQLDGDYAAYKTRVAQAEAEVKETLYAYETLTLVAELRLAELRAYSSAGVR